MSTASDRRFGFTVEYVTGDADYDEPSGWKVYLPHQCDAWRIDEDSAYDKPTAQETALEALDRFINEANAARAALARGEQHGNA
jgi:hypothetical protein